jgi:hypothetical protein
MNLKSIITGVAAGVALVMVSHAASPVTLDWQFNTGANPLAPDGTLTTNTSGGTALCTIAADTYQHYFFGAYPTVPPGGYGNESGLWDTIGGHITLSLTGGSFNPNQTFIYTLDIHQFVGDPNFLPGTIQITPLTLGAPSSPTSRTVLDTVPNGQWVDDKYTWTLTPGAGPLSLTINPSPSSPSGELLFDELIWNINPIIPEPGPGVIGALGMLAFGLRTWLRRKA